MKSLLIVTLLALMAQPFAAWAGDDFCPLTVRLVAGVKDFERAAWANAGFQIVREDLRRALSPTQIQGELGTIGANTGLLLVLPGGRFSLYWRDGLSAMALDLPLYRNFSGLEVPLCSDVQRLAETFAPRRQESSAAVKFLNGETDSGFSWGRFVLSLEAPLYYQIGTDSELATRLAQYEDVLKRIRARFEKVKTKDFLQRLDNLLQIRFEELGLGAYCSNGNTVTSLFRDGCAACQGETLITLAVLKDLNLEIPSRYRLGVQFFVRHVRPVLWDTQSSRVLDLIYGAEWNADLKEPVYDPRILLDAFVHGRHSGLNSLEISKQDSLPASCYALAVPMGQRINNSWDCSPFKRRWLGANSSEPLNLVRYPSSPDRGLLDDLNVHPTHRFTEKDPPERTTIAYSPIGHRAVPLKADSQMSVGPAFSSIDVTDFTMIKTLYDQRQLLNPQERAMMENFSELVKDPDKHKLSVPKFTMNLNIKAQKANFTSGASQNTSLPTNYILSGDTALAWSDFQQALSLEPFTRGKMDRLARVKGLSKYLNPVLNWSELPPGQAADQIKTAWPQMTMLQRAQAFEQVWNQEWQSHFSSPDARDLEKFLNEKISDSSHFGNRLARFTPWLIQTATDLKALWKLRAISADYLQPQGALDSKIKSLSAPVVDPNMRLLERLAARYALELGRSSRLVAGELSGWSESQLGEFFAFHEALTRVYLEVANESSGADSKNLLNFVPAVWPEWSARRYEFLSLLHYPLQPLFEGLLTDSEYQFGVTPNASDAERLRKVVAGRKITSVWRLKKDIQLHQWKPAAGFCEGKAPGFYNASDNFAFECRETAKDVVTVRKTFALPPYFIFKLILAQPTEYLIEPHARVLIALMWNDAFEQAVLKNSGSWSVTPDAYSGIRNATFGPSPVLQRAEGYYARLPITKLMNVGGTAPGGAWLFPPSVFRSTKIFPQEIESDPLYDLGLTFWLERAGRAQASLNFYAPIGIAYGWALRSLDDTGNAITEIVRSGEDVLIYSRTPSLDLTEHQPVGMNTPFNVDLNSLSRLMNFH